MYSLSAQLTLTVVWLSSLIVQFSGGASLSPVTIPGTTHQPQPSSTLAISTRVLFFSMVSYGGGRVEVRRDERSLLLPLSRNMRNIWRIRKLIESRFVVSLFVVERSSRSFDKDWRGFDDERVFTKRDLYFRVALPRVDPRRWNVQWKCSFEFYVISRRT